MRRVVRPPQCARTRWSGPPRGGVAGALDMESGALVLRDGDRGRSGDGVHGDVRDPEGRMSARPILFSGEMVRAILDGRKTQTRRVVKGQDGYPQYPCRGGIVEDGRLWFYAVSADSEWPDNERGSMTGWVEPCPYGQPGDRLWVRETWRPEYEHDTGARLVRYRSGGVEEFYGPDADAHSRALDGTGRWRPSTNMPRWASRLTLEVVAVRVERLQEISEADARAEGAESLFLRVPTLSARVHGHNGWMHEQEQSFRGGFAFLWDWADSKRGHGWDSNPWVWVVEFKVVTP
jgi:hypothetical protein